MSYFTQIFGMIGKRLLKSSLTSSSPNEDKPSTGSVIIDGFVVIMDCVDMLNPMSFPLLPTVATSWEIIKYTSPMLLNLALAHPYFTFASMVLFTDFPVLSLVNTTLYVASQSVKLTYRGVKYMFSQKRPLANI